MRNATKPVARLCHRWGNLPSYVRHITFNRPAAVKRYDPAALITTNVDYDDRYMPDEITRDHARRMHYAAHRMHSARTPAEFRRWERRYLTLRDRIVLGNRKLIYRAVRRRMAVANRADDMIGDCHIVLIQAVAAFNPWLGIRFSTYAYTCLVRALARLSQRLAADWLARSVPLESLPNGGPGNGMPIEHPGSAIPIEEFLRDEHPLLTHREKAIISRRFCLRDLNKGQTLETVGAELGLSKERVRQVQASALDKLRKALLAPVPRRARS
jgi:RNA polymerase sigma factor (sigma-70 family)